MQTYCNVTVSYRTVVRDRMQSFETAFEFRLRYKLDAEKTANNYTMHRKLQIARVCVGGCSSYLGSLNRNNVCILHKGTHILYARILRGW